MTTREEIRQAARAYEAEFKRQWLEQYGEKPTLANSMYPRSGPKMLSDSTRSFVSPLGGTAVPSTPSKGVRK